MMTFSSIRKQVKDLISFGLLSRVLNFFKGILIAYFIGANYKIDTYLVAYSASMLLTSVITDGLIVSLVPLFQKIDKRDGLKGRNDFANNVINSYVVLSFILIVVGFLIAPITVKIFGPGFVDSDRATTIRLLRLGLPIMTFHFIRGVCGGYLQSKHAFRAGARSGVFNSLIYIIYLAVLSNKYGLEGLIITGIIAVLAQVIVMMKAMVKVGYSYSFYILLKDRLLIRLATFMLPILIGIGINEVNAAIDNSVGSLLASGTVAELNYAYNIILFFIGAFIVAIVTAIFPILTEMYNKERNEELNASINFSFKLLLKLSIPLTIILIALSEPMVSIFYERGAFGIDATIKTAQILRFYSIGIVGMIFVLMINRIYYAIGDINTSLVIGILSLGLNLILDLILVNYMGARGIALGTSLSFILASSYGLMDLNRKLGFLNAKKVIKYIIRTVLVSATMALAVVSARDYLFMIIGSSLIWNLVLVVISSALGLLAYIGSVFLFNKIS